MTLSVTGDMEPLAGPPPFFSISASGTPTLFTGIDPGGLTAYTYFRNADGSYTNVLHVTIGSTGADPILQGVLIDPPASLTFDILGFESPGPNGFLTAPIPEPSSGELMLGALLVVAAGMARKRRGPITA
jgi:hypothetical protein